MHLLALSAELHRARAAGTSDITPLYVSKKQIRKNVRGSGQVPWTWGPHAECEKSKKAKSPPKNGIQFVGGARGQRRDARVGRRLKGWIRMEGGERGDCER